MFLQEGKKVVARNALDLCGFKSFASHFVSGTRDDCSETQDVTGHGDLQDERFAFFRGTEQLYLARTDDKDPVAASAFIEEGCAAGKARFDANSCVVRKCGSVQGAKHAQGAVFTVDAIQW